MTEKNILDYVSEVDEFLGMHNLFSDDALDLALGNVVKLAMKPDVPPQVTARLIVELESTAARLHIIASYYKNIEKPKPDTIEYKKKNMYFSVAEALSNIVAALKYNMRGI